LLGKTFFLRKKCDLTILLFLIGAHERKCIHQLEDTIQIFPVAKIITSVMTGITELSKKDYVPFSTGSKDKSPNYAVFSQPL